MKYMGVAASATALMASVASAASSVTGVTGTPEGFASGATGGGSADAVYPTTTDELVSYLGDSSARVIVLTQTYARPSPQFTVIKFLTGKQLRLHRHRGHHHQQWLRSLGHCHWLPVGH